MMTENLTKFYIFNSALTLLDALYGGKAISGSRIVLSWPDEFTPGEPTRYVIRAESKAGDVHLSISRDNSGGER